MLLSFLGPSVSIGPIKVSFARDWPAYPCCNGAIALPKLRYQLVISSKLQILFYFFFKYFCVSIDISWSQSALWPFHFSYISDRFPSKVTGYLVRIHSDTLKFTLWFSSIFFPGQYMPCDFKYTWLFKCLEVCLSQWLLLR